MSITLANRFLNQYVEGLPVTQKELFHTLTNAIFSKCRAYRYELTRIWEPKGDLLNFLMLNPSTADEFDNDQTVERCQRRSTKLGYGGLIVTNLFALRSTDPRGLREVDDPIGRDNDEYILAAADRSACVVCAWGSHGSLMDRSTAVVTMLREKYPSKLHVLKFNADGQPTHPLYLPYTLKPTLWTA